MDEFIVRIRVGFSTQARSSPRQSAFCGFSRDLNFRKWAAPPIVAPPTINPPVSLGASQSFAPIAFRADVHRNAPLKLPPHSCECYEGVFVRLFAPRALVVRRVVLLNERDYDRCLRNLIATVVETEIRVSGCK